MSYRKYKVYPNNEGRFKEVLVNKLSKVIISKKDELLKILFGFFQDVLDRFTPGKQKHIIGNNAPFMNKNLNKL